MEKYFVRVKTQKQVFHLQISGVMNYYILTEAAEKKKDILASLLPSIFSPLILSLVTHVISSGQ